MKVVETGLTIGEEGFTKCQDRRFDPSVKLTSRNLKVNFIVIERIMPHIHNMDGFFVAKLKKISDGPRKKI